MTPGQKRKPRRAGNAHSIARLIVIEARTTEPKRAPNREPLRGETWLHKKRGWSAFVLRVGSTVAVQDGNYQSFEYTRHEFSQSFRPPTTPRDEASGEKGGNDGST